MIERSIADLFTEQARRRPAAPALDMGGGRELTYGELDRLSARLARRLVALGVGPGVRVAFSLRRPDEVVAAMVAVARAGGAYVPVDPSYPAERADFLLRDSGAAVVLGEDLAFISGGESGGEGPLPAAVPLESLALVIYTSGSTGRPKGVAIPQRGVLRLVREADYVQLGEDDRVAMVSNVSFDAATWEVWGALLNGGCLVAIERESLLAPARLAAALRDRKVSALFLTTALFNQVAREVPEAFAPLRCLLFGGERVDPASVRRVLAAGPPARLLHVYGPTENSTFSTWEEVREVAADAATVPIGRAIANTHVRVVDEELWIGGAGLAWGYWDRPDVTAERFVPDPWGAPGERLYRSGDRVRLLPGGSLEFLGRVDRQVKIRGFRIEPGEVEAALALHPAVRDAAVVAVAGSDRSDGSDRSVGSPSDHRLVAYVVAEAGESVSGAALRAFLAERLPAQLVPAVVAVLPRMPLNANGKVDRDALPPPELIEVEPLSLPQAPSPVFSPVTELIAGIWAALLGRRRVEPHEDFFALGGHSLLATRAITRVRESCGVEIPLEALFEEPTAAGLARRIEQAGGADDAGPIAPAGRSGPLPLTFAQERLWLLDKASPGCCVYNLPLLLRLDGPLVPAALAAALAEVERRHEGLRTTFPEVDGRPVQVVALPTARPLPVIDLTALPAARREGELARRVAEEGERPFDLQRGPLLRLHLFRLGDETSALLAVAHHIVADGWSLGVLQHEIAAVYEAAVEGRPDPLAPLPLQVPDLAFWERGRPLAAGLAFWRERLAGLPRLELPADRPRPTLRGAAGATREVGLPPALGAAAGRLARREGATLFLTLLAAFAALLHRLTGSADLAVGTPVAQRDRGELEGLIGFLVNTLVVRLDLGGDPGFGGLLARTRAAVLAAHARREVPFERLVAELRPARHLDQIPLVQVLFSLNPPVPLAVAAGVRFRLERPRTATAKLDLALEVLGEGPDLRGFWEFPTALFEPATVARFAAGFAELLAAAVADPALPLSQLDLLGAGARHQVLQEWNNAASAFPREATVPGLFAARAVRTPEAPAVEGPGGILTYGELDRRARRLAGRLRQMGVGPDVRVGVRLERGAEMIVAFLAILQAGGAYVPLDPGYPEERLAFMAEDAGLRVLLTSTETDAGPVAPPSDLTADHLAYVIYTSGSTGRPKGVAVTHRAVVRLVRDTNYVQLDPSDRVAQASNASFDAATFEIWGALLNGACLVILDRETTLAPDLFARALAEQRISALFLTTALFNLLANADPACFRTLSHLLFGGEAVDPTRVAAVLAAGPPARLLHVYGPTESTTFATWQRLDAVPPGAWNLPIGRPLANTWGYVLDAGLAPVPMGVTGELYLGGDGLARGYTRPDLTAERFVPDPFGIGERLYRTGDLVRQRGEGTIEFLGRLDSQVKIRGFRVEPAEIEAALGSHPEVAECVVLARRGLGGETTLVAFIGGRTGAPALRAHLSRLLPDFMVPAAFAVLPELPKNANGKIDRAALLELPEEPAETEADAPRNPTEEILCGLWAELLERPSVGIHDDFFALGGHSLLGTRLMARVRQIFDPSLSLRTLFEEPTVAALAAHIEAAGGAGGAIRPQPLPPDGPETVHPLAPAQRRLWFLSQLAPGGTFLNVPTALRLLGALKVPALAAALGEIARRHEPLRTTFATVDGEPVQRISPEAGLPLPVVDLTHLPDEAGRLAAAVANQPFDLAQGPVARAFLLRLAPEEHVLLLNVHHLAFDGWSIEVFDRELAALYPSLPPLPPLPTRYVEIGAGQRAALDGPALAGQREYWRRQLAGLPRLELPTDRPRPAKPSFRGGFREAALPHGLEALCRRQGVTPFMALLALFQVLLARWTGQTDFAVGAPISGRGSPEAEGLIGFFVNTLALRADLSGEPGLPALLARVRQVALGAYAHQDLPFEALVEDLHPGRQAGVNPLFEVVLSLEEARRPPRLPGLDAALFPIARDVAHFDLLLFVRPGPDGWRATLNHRLDLFDGVTAERLLDGWTVLLAAALEHPEAPVLDLPLLRPAERHQAAIEWNDTAAPADLEIDRSIARQAALRPEALAVEGGGRRLSYDELDRRAGRLARRLLALGLPPEAIVALCLERSPELAVGALAALRAGCVYLPLDPETPAERLAWLVRDAAAPVVLTAAPWNRAFLGGEARVLRLDEDETAEETDENSVGAALCGRPPTQGGHIGPPLHAVSPQQLAYAIYTSGSTGEPKRAELSHGGLANLVAWYLATCRPGPGDRIGLVVNPAFDVSVLELWTALAAGASLHAPPRAVVASPRELLGWLAAEGITLCFLPTPLAEAVLGLAPPPGLALRGLMTGGDRLRQGPPPGFPAPLLNLYGPAEATVGATAARVDAGTASPPIGRPLANFDVHLLGPDLRPVPPGAVGEICLGGPGLARGYGGRPDLTAERFVPHPGPAPAGARLYRTGDLARWRRDGALDFLGRADHQVKIRGVRVEPGEIEARLAAHPAVAGAAVLAVGEGAGRHLVAFVVPRPDSDPGAEMTPASLRAHLRRGLPEAMVPAALHTLDAWPLTPRGKLDRGALAALALAETSLELPDEPPRGDLEREIARLWCEVLRRPAVGRDESFFDLGGHSLSLAAVQERLEARLGRRVPLVDLFEHPTVRALAAHLQAEAAEPAPAAVAETARRAGQQRQAAAWKERTRQARAAAPQRKG